MTAGEMKDPRELRILAPTAILGYGFPVESFETGLARDPHVIAVDAGSTDPGPYYLGVGESFTDRSAVQRDLSLLLEAAVSRKIPLIVGTAGGCGAAPHVAWCRDIIEEIARADELGFHCWGTSEQHFNAPIFTISAPAAR